MNNNQETINLTIEDLQTIHEYKVVYDTTLLGISFLFVCLSAGYLIYLRHMVSKNKISYQEVVYKLICLTVFTCIGVLFLIIRLYELTQTMTIVVP